MNADDIHVLNGEESDLSFLLDTSYPLLKEFREKCPGTYRHSQSVASMVETVSLDLGLDVTFMKVASMYHDIGKMNNPNYFTENQLEDENPHDNLDPFMSYQLISRHVPDTVNILLNNEHFPRKIIEIVSQHHGNGVIKYFFDKSECKNDDKFRYHCANPTTVESAVLMICDHVEARSRSYYQSGKFDPIDVIDSTINELLDDGELDGVTMKLGHLKKIKLAIGRELEGVYQKRVAYPDQKKNEENEEE